MWADFLRAEITYWLISEYQETLRDFGKYPHVWPLPKHSLVLNQIKVLF